jgi:hypothetical protein
VRIYAPDHSTALFESAWGNIHIPHAIPEVFSLFDIQPEEKFPQNVNDHLTA